MDYKDFKIDGKMVMDYCGESKDVVIPPKFESWTI